MRTGLALVAALIAALVPAAVAAPADSPGVTRAKLADAIADERRALELLGRKPPRIETAMLVLRRAEGRLVEILDAGGLELGLRLKLNYALVQDQLARGDLRKPDVEEARWRVGRALESKEVAMEALRPAAPRAPQCADRKDNDGDGLVDARHDGGCTNAGDATESSPLTCTLGLSRNGPTGTVTGTCSGPFGRLEVSGPFDTSSEPAVDFSSQCRYASTSKLECLMKDGVANPRHVVKARFKLKSLSVSSLRVLVKDFAGRGRAQAIRPAGGGQTSVDPVSARCAARFDFGASQAIVRCDGVDVKSSSAATGGPVVSAVAPVSASLASRCEAQAVSGSGITAARCIWKTGNKGKPLGFQFAHDRELGSVTIHALAGGSGEEGTTIVLRQVWTRLADGTVICRQSVPSATSCATP